MPGATALAKLTEFCRGGGQSACFRSPAESTQKFARRRRLIKMPFNYYAVANGRETGIFTNWHDCQQQVSGFPYARYKGFNFQVEAQQYLADQGSVGPFYHSEQVSNQYSGVSSRHCLYFDGASRGNPGMGGAGAVLIEEATGQTIGMIRRYVGPYGITNNYAEYTALCCGLAAALQLGVTHLRAYGDSNLVVNQMMGRWEIRNPQLAERYEVARYLASKLQSFQVDYIPRAENREADALANDALNGRASDGVQTPDGRVVSFDHHAGPHRI